MRSGRARSDRWLEPVPYWPVSGCASRRRRPPKKGRLGLALTQITAPWTGDLDGMVERRLVRVLTAFSVIILPLTLIASIWGMNVGVPGEGDEFDFYLVIGAMLVILVGMLTYFRRRGWI